MIGTRPWRKSEPLVEGLLKVKGFLLPPLPSLKLTVDWVLDKESSKFVFPAICWEKSYIPFDVWNARPRESNVVEVVHANVNMEGTQCTLVGGVIKGKHYDLLKQRSLLVSLLSK